jgi:DNA-3-methyladenine glycosylase I
MIKSKTRCTWCGDDPIYVRYHDQEWGVPVRNDRKLFEFLILEGAQAGLSWITILKRRSGYKKAFANFDPKKVARFSRKKVQSLMKDTGIIRNRLKIESAVTNAKAFLEVQKEFGSFSNYQWSFVKGKPVRNTWKKQKQLPAVSKISDAMSKDMKKRGFKFVGSTIIYAHMQAVGMVNDHIVNCFRYKKV